MKKSLPVFLTCASLALVSLTAQPAVADVSQTFAAYMEHLRDDEPMNYDSLKAAPPQQLLPEIKKYLGDPSEMVRVISLGWAVSIANSSRDLATRQEAVELALTGVEQEPLPALAENISSDMVSLPPSIFSRRAREIIQRIVKRGNEPSSVLRLTGVAHVEELRPQLQKWAAISSAHGSPVYTSSKSWSARWALAAIGDKKAVASLIAQLDAAPNVIERMNLFYWLANTRQPQAIAALARYLFSEERLPNTIDEIVPGPASKLPGPKLAFNVILFLSDVVEDWPADTVRKGTDEALAKARQWVTQQGVTQLKIKR